MNRMWAIVEREMRKFFRSPTLMLMAMILPLVQLVILGNAFGGKVTGARMGVVDYDHGEESLKVQEAFQSIAANIRTFSTIPYTDEQAAQEDVRTGKIDAAVVIPAQYSRRVLAGESPHIGLVVDNSDQFVSGSLESRNAVAGRRAQRSADSAKSRAGDHARHRGALPLHRVHEVSAGRLRRARHVYLGDDRRRHVIHRR